jgi:hypothetical protein
MKQIRAALITLHIVLVVLVAIPAPSPAGVNLAGTDPGFMAHVRPWARLFHADEQRFADWAVATGRSWVAWRLWLLSPAMKYLELVGGGQEWHMFSSPNRMPSRFVLDARPVALADDFEGWQWLSGLPAGSWRPELFRSERMRSLINAVARYDGGPLSESLCLHFAAELSKEWAQVRCRFIRVESRSWRAPDAVPHEEVVFQRVVSK